jgi:tRNA dimethylallyltransferase
LKKKHLISIVGPTAIGKTALSIKLAKYFKTEIISCDSRQFFKEMTIGTAVPEIEELAAAPHHFIQHKSISEEYNVGSFENEAIAELNELFKTNDVVIMVGGSGLYVNAVVNGLDEFPKVDKSIREELTNRLATEGIASLQKQLLELDPISYHKIAIDNPQRISRALEICIGSGKPYSSFLNLKKNNRNFETISIGLTADREFIYDRINKRVDIMLQNGLLDEVKALLPHQELNALNTVGYKELFKYLSGEWEFDFAISEIKKNTRRFAKRQVTWFKRNKETTWFDYKYEIQEVTNYLNKVIQKHA